MRRLLLSLSVGLAACAGAKTDVVEDTDDTRPPVDTDPDTTRDTYDSAAPVDTVVLDTEVDDTAPEDTGDGYFRPTAISYVAEIAVDATPAMRGFSVLRQPYPAYFAIEMSSSTETCRIEYALDPAAFGWAGQEGIDPALQTFLTTQNQLFGFKVATGLYTATTSSPTLACDNFPPGVVLDLPADALTLFSSADPVVFVGIDQLPEAGVVSSITRSFPWAFAENVLGGRMLFPFTFGTAGGGTSNFFSNGGLYAFVDETSFEVEVVGTALALHPAADAWDGTKPGLGYYWVIPTNGFTLSWTP